MKRMGSFLAVLVCGLTLAAGSGCSLPGPVRVMSFNIRYANERDGDDRWDERKELVFDTIRAASPDVLGLQEVLQRQAVEVREALPEYGYVGVGRDDGDEKGEAVPILFRSERLELVKVGHLWYGEESDRPGVCAWDAACPRMLTWALLRFRDNPLNEIYVINTHFDHRGRQARLESAKQLRRLVESLAGKPMIVMGDFNCAPGSPPYEELTADRGNLAQLTDAYAWLNKPEDHWPGESAERGAVGTFHGFTGKARAGRIDWILYNRRFRAINASVDRTERNARFPSDHFPVHAVLKLLPATDSGVM